MNKKELHDFLLKEVANFVETSLFQSVVSKYDVLSDDKIPFCDDSVMTEKNYKLMVLQMMRDILDDIDNDASLLKKDFLYVTSLPRFNNDNVLSFLQELYVNTKANFSTVTGEIFAGILYNVICSMMGVPVSAPEELPNELKTQEAMNLLEQGKRAGLLDNDFKPKEGLPDYVAALIADRIASLLNFPPRKYWYPFITYWHIKNLRQRFKDASKYSDYPEYYKKVHRVIR